MTISSAVAFWGVKFILWEGGGTMIISLAMTCWGLKFIFWGNGGQSDKISCNDLLEFVVHFLGEREGTE